NSCTGGQSCVAGVCACPAGQTRCGNACTTLQDDPGSCGACGAVCQAGQDCSAGACVPRLPLSQTAIGYATMCARRGDGSVWCWGRNSQGELGDGTTTDRAIPGAVLAVV